MLELACYGTVPLNQPPTPASQGNRKARGTPELSKGLEFDLVVLVDPASFGPGIEGAVDRYVAMTRATQQLVILTGELLQNPCTPGWVVTNLPAAT